MIKCVIIDDEPLARSVIKEYLQHHSSIKITEECNNGLEGIKAIQQRQPDIIFLDIQMPKINGFEMLELLEKIPSVIFTTAFDEYAIKAFDANAIDYLLKPFSRERFDKAISKFLTIYPKNDSSKSITHLLENSPSLQPDESKRIVIKVGSTIKIIPIQDVHFIEAYDDYVKIHIDDNFFLKKKTMNHFEQILDSSLFARVHRSFIIQLSQITRIETIEKDSHIAILKKGERIPLSKNGYGKLREKLGI